MATSDSISEELASVYLSDNASLSSHTDESEFTVWGAESTGDGPEDEQSNYESNPWPDPSSSDPADDGDGNDERGYTTRYEQAIVLMISWEEHDLGESVEENVRYFRSMWEDLYNYEVRVFKIPEKKPHLALTSCLVELANDDHPNALFIIWYDGHGLEHKDRRGAPRWRPRGEKSPEVDSSIISTILGDCEADILLFNNSCNSLSCDRFNSKGVVECISASAFSTATYGCLSGLDLSPSMTWAIYKILFDQKCVENGITVPELHRRICLATQWAGSKKYLPDDGIKNGILKWRTSYIRTQPVYTRLSADAPGPDLGGGTDKYVQLRLGVPDLHSIDPKAWSDWILAAPSGVWFPRIDTIEEDSVARACDHVNLPPY
ncbi:hypothetical protein EKO27_g9687 [Xylaria grammica]|uniref:Caspase family p20 domain-containing protein n=1 Tax=Xylaria grammica TaxID=363999 RepID=A0A439CTK5_9PEZI|nr:hypothetical protein EKO27_g9687 [Xylaria grammica]